MEILDLAGVHDLFRTECQDGTNVERIRNHKSFSIPKVPNGYPLPHCSHECLRLPLIHRDRISRQVAWRTIVNSGPMALRFCHTNRNNNCPICLSLRADKRLESSAAVNRLPTRHRNGVDDAAILRCKAISVVTLGGSFGFTRPNTTAHGVPFG